MAGTLCGQADPPLNATGKEQANALAASLKGWNVQRLYASDLQRAIQTAIPLAELWNVALEPRIDLREISFGAWEGKRWSEIRAHWPGRGTMESWPDLCAPTGETFASFRGRILRALNEIIAERADETIAMVLHLGVIQVMLRELSSPGRIRDLNQRIDYCAVYRIRIDGSSSELVDLHT